MTRSQGWPESASGKTGPSRVIVRPTKPAPISEEAPMPKIVSASPVATWLAVSDSVSTAKTIAVTMPASAAATRPETRAAGAVGDGETRDRAAQHHALDAEIEHAALLDHELPQRRQQDRRRGRDQRHHDRDEDDGAHDDAPSLPGASATKQPRGAPSATVLGCFAALAMT